MMNEMSQAMVESGAKKTNRVAAIDLGTNTALLLVADVQEQDIVPVFERCEITRLGQGVDGAKRLCSEAIERSAQTLGSFAQDAARFCISPEEICAVATSAARDASNRSELVQRVHDISGIDLKVIPGDEEARLTWMGATGDVQSQMDRELCVFDIGGGSSELIFGTPRAMAFRHSFDVGSVRLTERFLHGNPPTNEEKQAVFDHLRSLFNSAPRPDIPPTFIGVAGTVTTLFTLVHAIEPYDANLVHGARLNRSELFEMVERLFRLTVAERQKLKGMEPKRADVIAAGGAILLCAMDHLGVDHLTVSDRGLRWGLLRDRFGKNHRG